MTGWHLGPLVAFDLETTGVDVDTDRIVTACVAVIDGTGQTEPAVRQWLINPGVDIPKAATDVHGVTTEHAREHGQEPAGALGEIVQALFLTRGPIVAFNACYDLTLLDRECRRHNVAVHLPAGSPLRVVDPFVLDKHVDRYRKGKRNLEATCGHYGVRIDGAHDASHDALAAARVAWRIAQRYPEISVLSLEDLHLLQKDAKREQAASYAEYLRKQGDTEKAGAVTGDWPMVPYVEYAKAGA